MGHTGYPFCFSDSISIYMWNIFVSIESWNQISWYLTYIIQPFMQCTFSSVVPWYLHCLFISLDTDCVSILYLFFIFFNTLSYISFQSWILILILKSETDPNSWISTFIWTSCQKKVQLLWSDLGFLSLCFLVIWFRSYTLSFLTFSWI